MINLFQGINSCDIQLVNMISIQHECSDSVALSKAAIPYLQVPLPMAHIVMGHLQEAVARGRGHQDWGVIAAMVREGADALAQE